LAITTVPLRSAVSELSALLASPEVARLVAELDALNWTGQKGYGARALVGACLVKSLYALPWSRTARLIAEHEGLRGVLGQAPSQWSLYRFTVKLRTHADKLADCLDSRTTAWTWPWTAPTSRPTRTGRGS